MTLSMCRKTLAAILLIVHSIFNIADIFNTENFIDPWKTEERTVSCIGLGLISCQRSTTVFLLEIYHLRKHEDEYHDNLPDTYSFVAMRK